MTTLQKIRISVMVKTWVHEAPRWDIVQHLPTHEFVCTGQCSHYHSLAEPPVSEGKHNPKKKELAYRRHKTKHPVKGVQMMVMTSMDAEETREA